MDQNSVGGDFVKFFLAQPGFDTKFGMLGVLENACRHYVSFNVLCTMKASFEIIHIMS